MRSEEKRCELAYEEADKGKTVAMVCSGDPGIYGMASLCLEIGAKRSGNVKIEVIPGVTAACGGAALLGAPLSHDFAVISLSDLLPPWEPIEKRLRCAAEADFAVCIYNPQSHTGRTTLTVPALYYLKASRLRQSAA
jgi:precorrin-3B C17-methyltransferase